MTTIPLSEEYELTVRELVARLSFECQEFGSGEVCGGRTNLIDGASGFSHQIDASLHFPRHLVLLECKRFKRPVAVHHALAFAARLRDVQDAMPNISVSGSLVSTQPVTAGAIKIAEYFGYRIDQVTTLNEYVITIANHHFAGKRSGLVMSDRVVPHVIQDGG